MRCMLFAIGLVAGCAADNLAMQSHELAIHVAGDGVGWVRVAGLGMDPQVCTADCVVEMPPGGTRADVIQVTAGSPEQLVSSSCGLETDAHHTCDVQVGTDRAVTVTFGKDPHELRLLAPPAIPRAVGLSRDEVIIGSASSLTAIGLDGATRWTVTRPATLLATIEGRVVVGPDLAAFLDDGTPLWTAPFTAHSLSMSRGAVAALLDDGSLVELDLSTGAVHWRIPADALCVAVGPGGDVAVLGYGGVRNFFRFDNTGAEQPWMSVPDDAREVVSGGTSFLVHALRSSSPGFYEHAYYEVNDSGPHLLFSEPGLEAGGFAPFETGIARWRQLASGPLQFTMGALSLTKGEELKPSALACDETGHCAIAGEYDSVAHVHEQQSFVEIFDFSQP